MTIIMQCLGCGTVVTNPRVFNYMYEKCTPCALRQKDNEEKAIDSFLQAEAERKLEQDAKQYAEYSPTRTTVDSNSNYLGTYPMS